MGASGKGAGVWASVASFSISISSAEGTRSPSFPYTQSLGTASQVHPGRALNLPLPSRVSSTHHPFPREAFTETEVCRAQCWVPGAQRGAIRTQPREGVIPPGSQRGCDLEVTDVRVRQGWLRTRKEASSHVFGDLLSPFRPQFELEEKEQQCLLHPHSWGSPIVWGWGRGGQHENQGGFPSRRPKAPSPCLNRPESRRAEQKQVPPWRAGSGGPQLRVPPFGVYHSDFRRQYPFWLPGRPCCPPSTMRPSLAHPGASVGLSEKP